MKRIKVLLLFCLLGISCFTLQAQTQDWLWVSYGGGSDYDIGHGIVCDSSGNTYVTGYISGSTSFGNIFISSNGSADIFVAKLDANGNWLWAVNAGGIDYDTGYKIALDSSSNVYVTGFFQGSASFGGTNLTSLGESDIFVAKLDSYGVWQWVTQAGSPDWDFGYSIVVDDNANVYITGEFSQTAQFGNISISSIGSYDIFVAKLDSSGNWLWAQRAGSFLWDWGWSIDLDSNNDVYISGAFRGFIADFGTTNLTSSGNQDIFIAKLDNSGNWLWAKRAGGFDDDIGYALTVDNNDDICLAGFFNLTADFGSTNLTSNGSDDIFVAKIDGNGNWLWATQAGGSMIDRVYGIASDSNDNIFITGFFEGSSGFQVTTLHSIGIYDIFISKLDSSGNWVWAKRAGSTDWDWGSSLAVNSNDEICHTGYHYNNADFGTITLPSNGSYDVFVAKIGTLQSQPVQLSSFTASMTGNSFVELQWVSQTETNILGYNVFRNSENDLLNSNKINTVIIAGSGNSSIPHSYSYIDESIEMQNLYYYWLEMLEMDLTSSFYGPISILTTEQEDPETPPNLDYVTRLIGAFPNPFNPETNINFELALPANVSVVIYNAKGQYITSLAAEFDEGFHNLFWNGKDSLGDSCNSGIYLYQFNVDNFYTEYGKMMLLK